LKIDQYYPPCSNPGHNHQSTNQPITQRPTYQSTTQRPYQTPTTQRPYQPPTTTQRPYKPLTTQRPNTSYYPSSTETPYNPSTSGENYQPPSYPVPGKIFNNFFKSYCSYYFGVFSGSPGTAIGVYPPKPAEPSTTQDPSLSVAISKYPLYIIPFPFPLGGLFSQSNIPSSCPCYLVEPQSNVTQPQQQQNPQFQQKPQQYPANNGPYGYIGFIPVVFFPSCGGGNTLMPENFQNAFPAAQTVPYPCSQCQQQQQQQQQQNDNTFNNQLDPSNNFIRVLQQAGLSEIDSSLIKSPHRRSGMRRLKSRKRVAQPVTAQ
jgi:hypothetical protein